MGFIEDQVVNMMRQLPAERKHEVLHFVRELYKKYTTQQPRKSLMGIFADPDLDITAEEIDDVRREAWAISPKEHIKKANEA